MNQRLTSVARHDLPVETMILIAKQGSPFLKAVLSLNPSLPPELFDEITSENPLEEMDDEETSAFIFRANFERKFETYGLYFKDVKNVALRLQRDLVFYADTPTDVLRGLDLRDEFIREQIIRHHSCPAEILFKIYDEDHSPHTRAVISKHQNFNFDEFVEDFMRE